jgi:hypothetical protein
MAMALTAAALCDAPVVPDGIASDAGTLGCGCCCCCCCTGDFIFVVSFGGKLAAAVLIAACFLIEAPCSLVGWSGLRSWRERWKDRVRTEAPDQQ